MPSRDIMRATADSIAKALRPVRRRKLVEVWAQHPVFRDYWISTLGRVMRGTRHGKWIGRVIDGWRNRAGYHRVRLYVGGESSDQYVHVLVLEAHVSERQGPIHEIQCLHVDGSPANNRLENLRWDSVIANYDDQRDHGTAAIGDRNGNAKLSDRDRESIARSREHHTVLAKRYGVDESTIRRERAKSLQP